MDKSNRMCRITLSGICNIGIKKEFISSLHNAVELFFKQIMIDQCDYRVVSFRKMNVKGERDFYVERGIRI